MSEQEPRGIGDQERSWREPAWREQLAARDPLGIYMAGFTLGRTPAEAREAAQAQRNLAERANDQAAVAWWDQVLTFLAITE